MTGCFPYRFTSRVGFSGTVVDAATGAPLPEARISVGTNPTILAISAADGSFAVPPEKRWIVYFMGEDFFAVRWMTGSVQVEHSGYQTNAVEIFFIDSQQRILPKSKLDEIPLRPLAETHSAASASTIHSVTSP